MLEISHQVPDGWGLYPLIGPFATYSVFMLLAFAAGIGLYFYNRRNESTPPGEVGPIALAAFFGGLIGAKLPVVLLNLHQVGFCLDAFFSGRTIVGGLFGGMIAVWLVKRKLGIRRRFGNALAPSIALGMAIGRMGCLLTGCCFGKPTGCASGIDFGDHILRHPTQIYEGVFCLIAFAILQRHARCAAPGRALSLYFLSYFAFRFCVEFIRPHPQWMGLTTYQWICLAAAAVLTAKLYMSAVKRNRIELTVPSIER